MKSRTLFKLSMLSTVILLLASALCSVTGPVSDENNFEIYKNEIIAEMRVNTESGIIP